MTTHLKFPRGTNTLLKQFIGAACLYSLTLVPVSFAATEGDTDGDGILDVVDNCIRVANPDQRDTDGDGFGNVCDGDLDNNGIVNSLDYSLFKSRLLTTDPHADLNGDGRVNSIDFTLFKGMLLKPPGPGNPSEPTFTGAPPPVADAQVFKLSQDINGRNAVVAVKFAPVKELKPVLSFNFANSTVGVNDLGLEPDAQAGDGIYSGYFTEDFAADEKASEAYQERVRKIDPVPPVLFSGRDVINSSGRNSIAAATQLVAQPLPIKTSVQSALVLQPLDKIPILPIAHDPARSLMITHRNVVTDPTRTFDPCDVDGDNLVGNVNGAWSFKTLMTNMANTPVTGISAQLFTHNWLNKWMSNQTVNSFTINARTNMQNFFPGWNPGNPASLDMNRLPFRLLAIVNRIDLAKTSAYGGAQPGETRLVFGLLDVTGCPTHNTSPTRQMTVIFEYGDPVNSCQPLKNRANEWIALSSLAIGSPAYNAALQNLTDDVTLANSAPSKPNRSAINQVRTNEIALQFPWQLREFTLQSASSQLLPATIKQTPDPALFRIGSPVTASFMQNNAVAISCERHVVPLSFAGQPFLGSHTDYGFGTIWNAPAAIVAGAGFCTETPTSGVPTPTGTVRHKLSLNTCDDCHAGETQTAFTHVSPTGFPATLSGFLTGITVSDPGGEPVTRTFNDLTRRSQILEDIAVKSCISGVHIPRASDPLVLAPRVQPVFKLTSPVVDPAPVDFSRQQQVQTFVH